MKLVKVIQTNEYKFIEDSEYDSSIHIDRTSFVSYLDKYLYLSNYITVRNLIQQIINDIGGFDNLRSDNDKLIALKYTRNVTPETAIPFLMTHGYTQDEANQEYVLLRSQDILNAKNEFKNRLDNANFIATVMGTLGQVDAEIFLDNTRNFLFDLINSAILGTEYGNSRNGFFDYLNDTGDYVGTGASTFFDLPTENSKYELFKQTITNLILE